MGLTGKIMISQIRQHCWKGMCVGGKGVTEADRQRLCLETADNEEVVGLLQIGFRLLWLPSSLLHLLVTAMYVLEINGVLLILCLVLNQVDTFTLLIPSRIITLAPVLLLHTESLAVVPLPASKPEKPQTSHLTFFPSSVSSYLLEKTACSESCLHFLNCFDHIECSKWDLPMCELSWGVVTSPQSPFSPLPNFIPFSERAAVTTRAGDRSAFSTGKHGCCQPH